MRTIQTHYRESKRDGLVVFFENPLLAKIIGTIQTRPLFVPVK